MESRIATASFSLFPLSREIFFYNLFPHRGLLDTGGKNIGQLAAPPPPRELSDREPNPLSTLGAAAVRSVLFLFCGPGWPPRASGIFSSVEM